jgi:putative Holliday junction resolvase
LSVRVVGIDLGERRIGIAVSDSSGLLASPREVIVRSGDGSADRLAVVAAVRDAGGELVVVGLPVSLDGNERAPASAARREAEALVPLLELPVEMYDERHTTVVAARLRREGTDAAARTGTRGRGQGAARDRRGRESPARPRRDRAKPIDAEAAAVMLQSWLDARGGRPG